MKALLLKTSVWPVLFFSAMDYGKSRARLEQHTPMKAHAANNDRQSNNR